MNYTFNLPWSPVSVPHTTGTLGAFDTENESVAQVVFWATFLPVVPTWPPTIFPIDKVSVEGPDIWKLVKSRRIWVLKMLQLFRFT